ncbi:MAG: 4Fe-4S binding protein [Methanobacteriota archaeon]
MFTSKLHLRRIIQIIFFCVVVYLSVRHLVYGIERAAPIDGFCPFGGVATFLTLVSTGEFIRRVYWGSIILMAVTVAMTVTFGRAFCGYICPLGAIQEWARLLGGRIGISKVFEPPKKLDGNLRLLKYAVLLTILILTYKTGTLVFRTYDPYVALMHFGREFQEKIIGYALLALVLIVALFSKNIWCRYVCPLGAFYGILSKLKLFKILRDKKACTDCGECNRACPHGIHIQNQDVVKDLDCVSCLECSNACPVHCLTPMVSNRKVEGDKKFGFLVFAVFIGLVAAFILAGYWQSNQPITVTTPQGAIDPAGILGSMTLKFLIEETGIPLQTFQEELDLPPNVDTPLMLREIGTVYSLKGESGGRLETEDFRIVVSKEFGIPYSGKNGQLCA